jgi:hypothetical protein
MPPPAVTAQLIQTAVVPGAGVGVRGDRVTGGQCLLGEARPTGAVGRESGGDRLKTLPAMRLGKCLGGGRVGGEQDGRGLGKQALHARHSTPPGAAGSADSRLKG